MGYEKKRGIKDDFKGFCHERLDKWWCYLLKWGSLLRCGVRKEK